jgi:hypothetical protein
VGRGLSVEGREPEAHPLSQRLISPLAYFGGDPPVAENPTGRLFFETLACGVCVTKDKMGKMS